ncbi:MAG: tail fiber domain-containing protein, partial [bacterium]|nr:tail fiber domain-containing protein [bacterium]
SGNTPTLRLEQDGSSGFTPQTWDVAGNEANFFIRDATNGSTLPFKIKPGAPTSSIFVKADGKIGIGTESIDSNATIHHLTGSTTNAQLRLERSGASIAVVTAGNSGVNIGAQSSHPVKIVSGGIVQMTIDDVSPFILMADGGTYDGTWNNGSSREIKENIKNLTNTEAISALENLKPVTYNYKTSQEEGRVGFIAEDVPELVATKSRKNLSSMDIVAVLTKVVQQQQALVKKQQETISKLTQRIEKIENQSKQK